MFVPGRSKTGGERISNRQFAISHINSSYFDLDGMAYSSLNPSEVSGGWGSPSAVGIIA